MKEPHKRPSLNDVATAAGVSRATASMALRDNARTAIQTRERVAQVAAQLGYRPDPLLSALSARRWNKRNEANLGVLLDGNWEGQKKNHWPAWMQACLNGMEAAAEKFGYTLTRLNCQKELLQWKNPDRVLQGRGVCGLAVLPLLTQQPSEVLPALDWGQYSIVTIGNPLPGQPWHRCGTDAFAAMNLTCKKLHAQGVRRIGLVQTPRTEVRLRFEWLGALSKEWFLPPALRRLDPVQPLITEEITAQALLKWYRKERPQVVVSANSAVLSLLREAGLRVPEDVGVVLLNRDLSGYPNATGIAQHLDEVGYAAIELMHGQILRGEKGEPTRRREVLIPPDWHEGDTTRPFD